jgi:hypothetical protein
LPPSYWASSTGVDGSRAYHVNRGIVVAAVDEAEEVLVRPDGLLSGGRANAGTENQGGSHPEHPQI